MHYIYILHLANGQHYIGCTENLDKRLEKHRHHAVPTTSRLRPDELVFYAAFKSKKWLRVAIYLEFPILIFDGLVST
ncbi:hypothetical protein A2454_03615 [Candidatus Peribacteria bacterium RIFOXYC2_FULL_55_14]|nr:MAG: excinuclease ABC C subunit domain-containing protein [Candidatus Peribacteria bacterium GW2011_GWB1_54_5]KKW38556.1 MAG: excinuclease ABC C subunit domain-containing protein [Candidatus Peribacteria bacterium GW2011_GWC2_54_8]KKW41120.1 MAG: excinuclease ABC C subunit domain-containing protein [Candidatus Peregrinibacteria bacterium GW2011_GWA2_54_9]OGJ71488.1 MAG: hypothetical protein A2198_04760 [Candidatus Peribacteria bacterium RIFOXYA1_FULL_56_14]OGJ72881.1 MAG: hypothetical protei